MTNISPTTPWYKQFWPWFLMFFPAAAVVAGIATVILAVKSDDGLVNDDYYKAGLAINQTLEQKQKAQELGLIADGYWDSFTQTITLKLTGEISKPARLTLQFAHATRANNDQIVSLYLAPDKRTYTGRANIVNKGAWNTILEPEEKNWRINGRVTFPKQSKWKMDSK